MYSSAQNSENQTQKVSSRVRGSIVNDVKEGWRKWAERVGERFLSEVKERDPSERSSSLPPTSPNVENSENQGQNVSFDPLEELCRLMDSEEGLLSDLPELVEEEGGIDVPDQPGTSHSLMGRDVIQRPPEDFSHYLPPSAFEDDDEEEEDIQVGGNLPLTDYYEMSRAWNVYLKKFKLHGKAYHIDFKNIDQMANIDAVLIDIIRKVLEDIFADGDPTDKIGVTFEHPGLRKGVYGIPFQLRSALTPERIFDLLVMLIGYDDVNLDESFKIIITRVAQTRGGGGGGKKKKKEPKIWKQRDFMKKHTGPHGGCFIQIHNPNDDLCFPRAVVVAKARREHLADLSNKDLARKWESIRKGDNSRCTLQKRMAQELVREAGLQDHEGPFGDTEFERINSVVAESGYQIKIFSSRCMNLLVYQGKIPADSDDKVLHIYHDFGDVYDDNSPGHFLVCTKPHALFRRQMWCDNCNRAFQDKLKHRCISKCNCCYSLNKCKLVEWKQCNDCNRRFRSDECFQKHITVAQPRGENKKQRVNQSICEKFKCCPKCERMVNCAEGKKVPVLENGKFVLVKPHKCGYYYCFNCKDFHLDGTNVCFMQPIVDRKKEETTEVDSTETENEAPLTVEEEARLKKVNEVVELLGDNDPEEEDLSTDNRGMKIFFDFECSQVKKVGENNLGPIMEHVPNYCNVQKVCMECQDDVEKGIRGNCVFCKKGEWIFEGDNTKTEFCEWLFTEENRGATVIAHNSKGYDSQFIIQYLIKEAMVPKVVMKGTQFLLIQVNEMRLIDSLNFFPMGLSELPKAFNLKELKKGYFPHKFNTPENWNYVGQLPDAWFYDPGNMKSKKREAFYEWYGKEKARVGENFNFHEELAAYCKSDVDILMKSCLTFEKDLVELVDMRPFNVAITIASFCMKLFQKKFLKPNTIGLIPHSGYRGRENQSMVALRWLKWVSEQQDIHIQHAGNGYEKRIGKYKVDGFHPETNTIYEFNGCVWHGHTCQNERTRKVPNSSKTLDDAYQAWITRKNYLESEGYRVVEMWQCQYERLKRQDPHMKAFVDAVELPEPLDVSESLRGGRTNATRLYYKCKPGETMHYVDVVSLYPWGVKWTRFPKGHPTIITENFQPIRDSKTNPYFGVIKCKVLPPKQLLHPILPYKCGGKLMFPLCRTCAQSQHQGYCNHSDSGRAFTGEFVSTELNKALEKGYRVVKIYEVWHYPESEQHNGIDENTGLFTRYINFFLKLKIEASGWPDWVKSEEDKQRFIDECKEREGIDLDPSKIEKNPGRRQIAKLCLNSFWGKFGQRSNMGKNEFVNDPAKFTKIMFSEENVVESVNVVNEEVLLVSYSRVEEYVELMPHMNKVIAAFTTANCRLRLYEELEKLGERVCYFDTDSVIYITRPGDTYHPKLGSFLGEMTDEIAEYGPGAYIEEFVSGGPKNYGYKVRLPNGETEEKVKIRGFTLNHHAANRLNMENLKRKVFEFVKGEGKSVTTIVQPQICRTKDRRVVTKDVAKNYGLVYDKRWVLSDFSTLPYGMCQ